MTFIQKTKDGVLGIFEYMPHAVQAVGPALYPGRLLHGHAGTCTCTCVYTLDEIEQTKLIHSERSEVSTRGPIECMWLRQNSKMPHLVAKAVLALSFTSHASS